MKARHMRCLGPLHRNEQHIRGAVAAKVPHRSQAFLQAFAVTLLKRRTQSLQR
jgi:hypothetical protein